MKVTDGRRHSFFIIDNDILDSYNLEPFTFKVYCYLARLCGKSMTCYPSITKIAETTQISRPTVCKAIKTLSLLKLIHIEKKLLRDTDSYENNIYTLLDVHTKEPASNTIVLEDKIIDDKKEEKKDRFDEFWNKYDYRIEKTRAHKAYSKHITSTSKHEKLLIALENYKKIKETWKAWKMPATFINNHEDYLEVLQARPKKERVKIDKDKIYYEYIQESRLTESMETILDSIAKRNKISYYDVLNIVREKESK